MRSWFAIRARDAGAEVSIYDEIGAYGVSAKSFLDELGAVLDDGPLTLRLNSPEGSWIIRKAFSGITTSSPAMAM